MADGISGKAQGLMDGLEDVSKPAVADMRRALKRYVDAEAKLLPAVQSMGQKASGLLVGCLAKVINEGKGSGPQAEAIKKRKREFDKVNSALDSFGDAIDGLVEGTGGGGKVVFPGDLVHDLLDKLEYTDKGPANDLRKAAQAYYPAESAARKKLAEWSVHLGYLATALNTGLAELDPADQVENLNLQFGRNEVLAPALELKRKIDAM
jgi:hypothetical protein